MKSYCGKCKTATNQKVLHEEKREIIEHEDGWWEDHFYQIIECLGCEEISFRKLYNDVQQQSYYDGDTTTQELFPERGADKIILKSLQKVPTPIQNIYKQTIEAFNKPQKILCAVGLRACIEAICINKGISKGEVTNVKGVKKISKNLDGKIEGLVAAGFLTSNSAQTLHALRFLGNEAVHDLTEPDLIELRIAIEILDHIIENIYQLQYKLSRLKQRKELRKI